MELDRIYNEDCIETMKRMPDNFIDLTVTSPPYDNLRTYNGYCFDFENIAKELYRVTKSGGVVVWNVNDATIDGSETGTSFRQALYFMECGFNLHDTMIYAKNNPIPLNHNRYEQCFEFMFVFSKGKPKAFNPLKEKTLGSGKKYRCGVDSYIDNNQAHRHREQPVTMAIKDTRFRDNIWFYTAGGGSTGHPAPFPEQLAADHIRSWSNEGDVVLDPFMGSGTTAKMALTLNRHYIGSEISEEYCKIIDKRLMPLKTQYRLFDNN